MGLDFNELSALYAKVNIEMLDIYCVTIPAGGKSFNATTTPGVCGIVFPLKGHARFMLDRNRIELEPGIVLHAGPDMKLDKEVLGNSEWKYILLHYKVAGDDSAVKMLEDGNFVLDIGSVKAPEIDSQLQKLLRLQDSKDSMAYLSQKAMLYSVMEQLLRFARENAQNSKEKTIGRILEYIHDHLNESLTVSELAEKIGLDSRQFHYEFLKQTGICPKRYLMQSKMKRAKELLEYQNYSITQISDMVGYEDPLHFSRVFKKSTGISPTQFRSDFEKNPWRI